MKGSLSKCDTSHLQLAVECAQRIACFVDQRWKLLDLSGGNVDDDRFLVPAGAPLSLRAVPRLPLQTTTETGKSDQTLWRNAGQISYYQVNAKTRFPSILTTGIKMMDKETTPSPSSSVSRLTATVIVDTVRDFLASIARL